MSMITMDQCSVFWAVAVLAVLFGGPAGAAGRALNADTPLPAAAGVEPAASFASVLPDVQQVQAGTAEVQNAPLSQAATPAPSNTLNRVSSRKGPTIAPPPKTTKSMNRTVKQLPAGISLMTAGDLKSQFTGPKRPQVFRGRSKGFKTQANGVGGIPYSDSRFTADYVTLAQSRVGRLIMVYGGLWYACTASVINRALLVTAAHCVCDWGLGPNCFPDTDADGNLQVFFDPGRDGRTDPSTWWSAAGALVPSTYAYGTDTGLSSGYQVNNDLALVWLKPKDGKEVGDVGGWFSYAVNGWGFAAPSAALGLGVPTAPASSQVTVLGYPAAFDYGDRMQISNSAAYTAQFGGLKPPRYPRAVENLIRGSSFTPGSSGASWVANYGIDADIISDDFGPLGQYGPFNVERNVVLGVVSYGHSDSSSPEAPQLEFASMFATNKEFPASTYGTRGPGNIGALMYDACDNPALAEWQLKSKGLCDHVDE